MDPSEVGAELGRLEPSELLMARSVAEELQAAIQRDLPRLSRSPSGTIGFSTRSWAGKRWSAPIGFIPWRALGSSRMTGRWSRRSAPSSPTSGRSVQVARTTFGRPGSTVRGAPCSWTT